MAKLKFSADRIRTFFYLRVALTVLFGLFSAIYLFRKDMNNALLFTIMFILMFASTVKYHGYVDKTKGKKYLEVNVNPKKIAKTRAFLGVVFLLFGVGFLYAGKDNQTTYFLAIFFIVLGCLMFWRIYRLKRRLSKE